MKKYLPPFIVERKYGVWKEYKTLKYARRQARKFKNAYIYLQPENVNNNIIVEVYHDGKFVFNTIAI